MTPVALKLECLCFIPMVQSHRHFPPEHRHFGLTNPWCFFLFYLPFNSVQSLSQVWLFVTPWTEACQASLFIINTGSSLKLMSMELVMPSNHLILCHSLLLLPSIFPSIRVFSSELALHIRWPKDWNFSISPSKVLEYYILLSAEITVFQCLET